MNQRARRNAGGMQQQSQKPFVAGGIYDARQQYNNNREAPPPPRMNMAQIKQQQDEMAKFMNPEPPKVVQQQQPQQQQPLQKDQKQYVKNLTPNPLVSQQPQQQQQKTEQQTTTIPVLTTPMINTVPDDVDMNLSNESDSNKDRKGYFKKVFSFRKKPSIRAKEKKIRQNRRLRKVLLPKNALMALHEVKNIKIEDFVINNNVTGGFTATVSVNNVQYEGLGNSKNAAKNSACEKALRDLVISKMNRKPQTSNVDIKMEDMESNAASNASDGGDDIHMEDTDDDDVPMLNLASFALFKLFSEWEAAGFEIPEFRPTTILPSQSNGNSMEGGAQPEKIKKPPTIRTELPPNWENMHPTTLLCMMRPGITYSEEGCEGQTPNIIQKMGVTVDNEHFIGVGRSKKIARKNAAVNACNKLYGSNFIQFEN